MFSRIQTLFLLLAVVATSLSFVFPVIAGNIGTVPYEYNNYGVYMMMSGVKTKVLEGMLYLVAAAVLLSLLFAVSQFKKRKTQIMVCRVSYLLILVQFALYFFIPESTVNSLKLVGDVTVGYGVAFFMPLVALVFTFLAERAIKKDEALVRSADRLR